MLHSMTGYGRGEAEQEGLAVSVEIKTVNHRYADISVKLPRLFLPLETEIRRRASESLRRGKIDIYVSQEAVGSAAVEPVLNLPLAQAYQRVFQELRAGLGLTGDVPLALVAGQRDVISLDEIRVADDTGREVLMSALDQAVEAVLRMRRTEGEALVRDIVGHLDILENLWSEIGVRAPQVAGEWRLRLQERLERIRGEVEFDPQRVAQEVVLFSDRCDISEELARFDSHMKQFRELLTDEEPVGRRMDFLLQELNREVNTMGSKANDAELSRLVVEMKATLERVREQVQNIE